MGDSSRSQKHRGLQPVVGSLPRRRSLPRPLYGDGDGGGTVRQQQCTNPSENRHK